MRMRAVPAAELLSTELNKLNTTVLVDSALPLYASLLAAEEEASCPRQTRELLAAANVTSGERAWVVESRVPPRPLDPRKAHAAADGSAAWAYRVLDARPGTVLLPTGASFGHGLELLRGAAVLLLHVCGCEPSIYGVVLNRPTAATLRSILCERGAERYDALASHTVHAGGPVAPRLITVLSSAETAGATQVAPGLYVGGSLLELQARAASSGATAGHVAFYSGYVAWPLDELRAQVDAGVWSVVKASPKLLFQTPRAGGREAYVAALEAALL